MNADNPLYALSLLTGLPRGGGVGLFGKLIKPLTCEVSNALDPVTQLLRDGMITPRTHLPDVIHQIHLCRVNIRMHHKTANYGR